MDPLTEDAAAQNPDKAGETGEKDRDDVIGELVGAISAALESVDRDAIRKLTASLRAPDFAEAIELLDRDDRVALINILGDDFDYDVFSELDETVRDDLSEQLPNELLAKAVAELDTDDAAYLIENMAERDRQEIFDRIPFEDRAALERNFEYEEDTAGRIMQSEYVAVAPFWTVGRVIDYMRESDGLPDTFSEIFVVDPGFKVIGAIQLSRLLRTRRGVPVSEIMNPDRFQIAATEDQEEVARKFRKYDLMSAPVVDENERLVGVVTVDDVVDVIQDEAEEDMLALGGVGDETLTDSVYWTVRSRVPWLVVNLATAILASLVIQQFDATIEQMVALAVLMPIVASMGGNAATQTMTVTVRALAMNKLSRVNASKIIGRETFVGLANGMILSVISAAVAYLWFGSGMLALVIALAMVVNLLVAAVSGILVPMLLDYYGLDPAPASGVLITTVTDVIGFFAFLGLASLWLF
ncbi:MAG: magnesium transporter [Alphaproteobacteria bacterium]|nr:magnesium transporter [Alphaproteobacteria bacterium]